MACSSAMSETCVVKPDCLIICALSFSDKHMALWGRNKDWIERESNRTVLLSTDQPEHSSHCRFGFNTSRFWKGGRWLVGWLKIWHHTGCWQMLVYRQNIKIQHLILTKLLLIDNSLMSQSKRRPISYWYHSELAFVKYQRYSTLQLLRMRIIIQVYFLCIIYGKGDGSTMIVVYQ